MTKSKSGPLPLEPDAAREIELRFDAGESRRRPTVRNGRPMTISPYFRFKYSLEKCLAVLLLIPALPIIGVLYLLVRLTSKGPGFYKQERVGKLGRSFWIYKLRSMRVDAESQSGPVWATQNDDRTTRLGRWLRKTHLDELPQLFNVVKGEMTIVGPRPERPFFVKQLSSKFARYRQRLLVRPGITGMAQIYLPPDEDDESVRKKLAFDLEYVRSASFRMDVKIWICTALRLMGLRGGWGPRLVGLDKTVAKFRQMYLASRDELVPLHVELRHRRPKSRRRSKRQAGSQLLPLSDRSLEIVLSAHDDDSSRIRHPR